MMERNSLAASAYFIIEPFDLADRGDSIPYYRREMAILDKIPLRENIIIQEKKQVTELLKRRMGEDSASSG